MTTRATIQARIDDTTNSGFVPIEPGHIKLDRPLVVGHSRSVILQGSGPATILEADFDSAPVIDLQGATEGKRDVHRVIRDMVITRGSNRRSDPIACGIMATQQANLTLSGLVFLQHPWGVRADRGTEWRITDCKFTLGCTNGIRFHKTINVYMNGCILEIAGVGIEVTGDAAFSAHSVHLSQCQIVNGAGYDYGVIFDGMGDASTGTNGGDANSMTQCVLEGARHSHVYFLNKASNSLIANCWFGKASRRSNGGGGNGIQVDPNCHRISISNNRFGGQFGTAVTLDRVQIALIQGNRFEGTEDHAGSHIHMHGCSYATVANNIFEWHARSAIFFQTAGASQVKNANVLVSGNDFSYLNEDGRTTKRPAIVGADAVHELENRGNMFGDTPWS
jgi:hypothetical protein